MSTRVTVSASPVPTVSLAANPTSVTSGGASTLIWSSTNATSCTASGGWSGTKATSGSQSTGALTATGNFTLTCTGTGGSASASATVTVAATGTIFGLEFPGDGAVRRMLFWHNPFPIYDATYIFRVFPARRPSRRIPDRLLHDVLLGQRRLVHLGWRQRRTPTTARTRIRFPHPTEPASGRFP